MKIDDNNNRRYTISSICVYKSYGIDIILLQFWIKRE